VHVRTPEQFERWSWLVAIVFNQLYVARTLGVALPPTMGMQRATSYPRAGSSDDANLPLAAWHTSSPDANLAEKLLDAPKAFIPSLPNATQSSSKNQKTKKPRCASLIVCMNCQFSPQYHRLFSSWT